MPQLEYAPGCRLHYLEENPAGQESLLLLHGLGASGASWLLNLPVLARAGFHVIAPDLPGFGSSTWTPGQPRIRQMSETAITLLNCLGLMRAHVAGLSMGGTVALTMVLDHPERVGRLALVSTFARLKLTGPRQMPYFLLRFLLIHLRGMQSQAGTVAERVFPKPDQAGLRAALMEQALQANLDGYRAAMRALARFNVEKRLGEIHSPTLVVTGADDTTVTPDNQRRLAQGIPGAQQVIIPDAGHGLTVEKARLFNNVLIEFLRRSL